MGKSKKISYIEKFFSFILKVIIELKHEAFALFYRTLLHILLIVQ